MRERFAFDYAVLRVVPRVERGEFLNAGVILFCSTRGYLDALIELDVNCARMLSPALDLDVVREHLQSIPRICAGGPEAGPIGLLPQRARFHWLVAPRSTIVQTSAVHSGLHEDPRAALESLFQKLVQRPVS
jgi:hypothetical protein